jgi:tetratricopeptide (TPR) repeat protein
MGDSGYWRRVEEIFHEALERPDGSRTAFLAERCAGDTAMEREVRGILAGYTAQERVSAGQGAKALDGARFGAFELVKQIGEGGMGAVYLARRRGDFDQRAAVKLINGTPAAAALMAERFRQERQILATLEHPNIARVLDGGVTAEGQPYLAMEYVEGERVDRYCARQNLPLAERLKLFRKICAAVHYAHQHLVVHRDLKPANILVDQQGEPKLLDFGIAKVLDPPGAAPEHLPTRTMAALMTPEYASPEQIQGQACTVASDVYSLGVILYELLAGKRPFADTASTPAEMIAAVVTTEARRPSLAAPENLKSRLRGDLDGIVMKALAKKPEERYGSAEQLSEDIRRYLEGLPVSAVEGTRAYVARKFVVRHKVGVAAAGVVLLSLIAGLAGTLWQARVAESQRAVAEQRFSDARKLANYLLFPLFDAVQPLAGSLPVRADMAGQSLQYLDRLSAAKSTDRALRLELAEGYLRLGSIFWAPSGYGDSLGDSARALDTDRKALALLEPLAKEEPANEQVRRDLASGYLQLGSALNVQSQPRQSEETLRRAVGIFDRLASAKPGDAARQLDAARAWESLMDVVASPGGGFMDVSMHDTVLAAGNKALDGFRAVLAASPADSGALLGMTGVYITLAGQESPNSPRQALETLAKGREAFDRLPADVRASAFGQEMESALDSSLGWTQQRMGLNRESVAPLKRAGDILDVLTVRDPKNGSNWARRANIYLTLAQIHMKLKDRRTALDDYVNAIKIYDGFVAADPNKTSSRMIRATCEAFVARLFLADGRTAEGTKYARDGIADLVNLAERPGATAQYVREASIALMVSPILSLRDYPRALRYAQRADELSNGKEPTAIAYLAMAYANNGDGQKALEAVQRGFTLVQAPKAGEKASDAWQNLADEQRDIKIFIKTGKLPADFNQ